MLLCVALLYSLKKGQNIKKLLFFFVIAIIMIAYPSIQEIQIEADKISFTKYKEQVEQNPNDSTAVAELEKMIPTIKDRFTSTDDLIMLSEAYVLLEKSDKAIEVVDKGIKKEESESNPKVKRDHLTNLDNIKRAAILQKEIKTTKPTDTATSINQLKQIKTLDPKTRTYFKQKYSLQPKRINQ